ncbi:MAG TPA: GDP-mannose 4,6-dehydratase [Mariprofundaceae bacterium]|nr:GDP-mannose 4,6-dehydratase [Mariprofundaceae bacterium]
MKLLITGGCGFLGSNLAHEVLRRGDALVVFDNLSRLGSEQNLSWLQGLGEFEFVRGDIRDAHAVAEVVARVKPDVVFHLAGQVAMTTSIADPRYDFEVNALGSLNLLEAIRHFAPAATVVYSSTNKVYGDLEWVEFREANSRYVASDYAQGFDESVPLEFHSPYGCSKGAADQYMLDYARIFGLNTVVFRHSSMYGGRQFSTIDQGWIGWFCQQAIDQQKGSQEPFTIAGNGKQVRDVLHAEDMKRLYFSVVERSARVRGQVFNIGGGMENSLSLLELFALLKEITGTALNYVETPPRESDQKVFVADIRKARELLDWRVEVSPRAGVQDMIDWLSGSPT